MKTRFKLSKNKKNYIFYFLNYLNHIYNIVFEITYYLYIYIYTNFIYTRIYTIHKLIYINIDKFMYKKNKNKILKANNNKLKHIYN